MNVRKWMGILMCACMLTMVGCSKDDSNSPNSGSGTGSRGLSVELKNVAGGAWLLRGANGTKDGLTISTQKMQQLVTLSAPVLLAISSQDTTFTTYAPCREGNVWPDDYHEYSWEQQGMNGTSGHGIVQLFSIGGRIVLTDDVKLPASEPGGMEEDCVLALYVQELTETTMTCTYTLDNEQMACTYMRLGYNPASTTDNEGGNGDSEQPQPLEPVE